MLTNALNQSGCQPTHSLELPAPFGKLSFAPELADFHGFVCTTVHAPDLGVYGRTPDALTRSAPLRPTVAVASSVIAPSRFSAKDLIAELDFISAQVQKMMAQVENAVARLTTSR